VSEKILTFEGCLEGSPSAAKCDSALSQVSPYREIVLPPLGFDRFASGSFATSSTSRLLIPEYSVEGLLIRRLCSSTSRITPTIRNTKRTNQ
jgi:hypothetical protein